MNKKNDGRETNIAKGVNITTEFNEFKDVLFNKKIIRHKMKGIRDKKHKIGTYEIDKIWLSCSDDKRYVLDDRIHTLAYFHKDGVTNCNKKDCDKKDCDKKGCNNWKTLRLKNYARNGMNLVVMSVGQSGHFEPFLQKDFTGIKERKGTKIQPSKDIKGIKKHKNVNKHISNFFSDGF